MIEFYLAAMGVVSGYTLGMSHSEPDREWYDIPLALACGLFWPAYIFACAWCYTGAHERLFKCLKWWKR